MSTLRVLVVDDSPLNRFSIDGMLSSQEGIEVIGRARNGEEALQLAIAKKPDVITLDIEMPRMDGFTFLRILMNRQPTPVIVVSSYGNKDTVFRALELGAIDFVARSEQRPDDPSVLRRVLEKVLMVRHLKPLGGGGLASDPAITNLQTPAPKPSIGTAPPKHIIVIAASTGGPTALIDLFRQLPARFSSTILVAQHMPDRFTRTFAERLDRRGPISVREAKDGDGVYAGLGLICPGGQWLSLRRTPQNELDVAVSTPPDDARFVPSADELMKTAASAGGSKVIGIILTGMGDDGVEGARAIRAAGGLVIAESEQTATIFGMPGAAIRAKTVDRILPLPEIGRFLAQLG